MIDYHKSKFYKSRSIKHSKIFSRVKITLETTDFGYHMSMLTVFTIHVFKAPSSDTHTHVPTCLAILAEIQGFDLEKNDQTSLCGLQKETATPDLTVCDLTRQLRD